MRTFLLAFQRSTTQDITTMLNIRIKLQESNEKTIETTNWYGSQSTGPTSQRSTKSTETQRRKQQCLRDMEKKRKGQTFVKGRYNKQMTDYYTTTTASKTTLAHIEEQDAEDETEEEPDNTQKNDEGEDQPTEGATKRDDTGNRRGKDKKEKDKSTTTQKDQIEKKQSKHPIRDWPNKPTSTCIFPTVNGGMRIAAFRNKRVSIRPSTTHGRGLFLDASPGTWEVNNRSHHQRSRKPQYFDPGPVCRYHGPRYTTATLPVEVTDNNDYIYEHRYLDIYIDGQAPLPSHARSMNEGFENNNSELRWWKGELWVFTLWALEEGYEYALPYWREKGDKDTLVIAGKYYKTCQEQLDKKKPLDTKAEDK